MILAAADVITSPYAQFGFSGIFAAAVVWLALYILKDKNKQLDAKDTEIVRLREELAGLRMRVIEPLAPALDGMTRTLNSAVIAMAAARGSSVPPT